MADATDSSVTLSEELLMLLRSRGTQLKPLVFVFFIPATRRYAFMLNPDIDRPTQLAELQCNSKFGTVGFETLCPTVSRILYDYGISALRCRLAVTPRKLPDGRHYYQIERPHLVSNQ